MFACLWLPTPREVSCCGTSGEFPSLNGLVCMQGWHTLNSFSCNYFVFNPPKKQTVTKVLLLQMTFLNNDLCSAQYRPCQLLLCLNPANFPSPHSITVRFSHSSSILHPLTYAHILTDIAFTSLSFSREWTEMKGLPWNGCAVVIRDWTNTLCMSLSVALSRGPSKEQ